MKRPQNEFDYKKKVTKHMKNISRDEKVEKKKILNLHFYNKVINQNFHALIIYGISNHVRNSKQLYNK